MNLNPEQEQFDFIRFALEAKVLSFGEFKTKAGRLSPYFFNAGLFYDGSRLGRLGEFYARALIQSEVRFDMLYGPAYKGITLAASTAIADAASGDAILSIPQPTTTNHKGGTLVFDTQGRLLISSGDGGNTPGDAQLASSLRGKILRIDPATDAFPADTARDYAIPAQNPFSAGGGLAEIYAMGLRNPFRISVDPVTGDAFIGEVGQSTLEEVDRIPASQSTIINFGWDLREGSLPFNGGADSAAYTLPVTEYGRTRGGSITGIPDVPGMSGKILGALGDRYGRRPVLLLSMLLKLKSRPGLS